MIVNGALTGGSLMLCAAFQADTPHAVILLVLAAHGFLRSLQLICLNTLTYADLSPEQMSSGSTIMGIAQQLAQSLGIGLCATVVQWLHAAHGGGPITAADVSPAFIAVAAVSLLSIPFFLRLRPRRAPR